MGLHNESIFLRQPRERSQAPPVGVEGLVCQAVEGQQKGAIQPPIWLCLIARKG